MLTPFRNEPFTDFTNEANKKEMLAALDSVKKVLGKTYPIVIGGEERMLKESFDSINPSNKTQSIGKFSKGGKAEATEAVAVAKKAFESWHYFPAEERAAILLRAARMMRQKKFELNAWMILEEGKSWAEADGDIAEAIDFCEYYARLAIELDREDNLVSYPGTYNHIKHLPLGVGAVIPPWNFPSAILTGMTTAALVSGNTVVLKPSSDSPAIAWQVFKILNAAGIPDGVLNFVTGGGASVGNTLVEHPDVAFVSFTGSREVGTDIYARAAVVRPGQKHLKRVIAEMGGKDAVVVDESVENLDEVAQAVVTSAFGFQGQKCSAGSRLIVHKKIHDALLEKVIERTQKITVGPTEKQEHWMGPVINQGSFTKIMEYIGVGKKEGKLVSGGEGDDRTGYFIQPTIFDGIKSKHRLGQEEIFGPVLAVITANNFEELIEFANDTEYGLTGAFISSNRDHVRIAKERFHVGNLYINRKCTGALVGVEPFGGFYMSGTDSKAGGAQYLYLHTQPKAISEKL
ncbi:L-glutamate gamma-semialdehyde dehydrogenase [Candidatus Acetothermia bacterium]|nr:L-glutamate gamma-semialdehyde dehydrogenase [Candidatus Acetothermia bacterium]